MEAALIGEEGGVKKENNYWVEEMGHALRSRFFTETSNPPSPLQQD